MSTSIRDLLIEAMFDGRNYAVHNDSIDENDDAEDIEPKLWDHCRKTYPDISYAECHAFISGFFSEFYISEFKAHNPDIMHGF